MEFIDEKIEAYALSHSQSESDVLKKLNRETHLKVLSPRMLSGHLQGNFLSMISKMIQPKQILEIGTYTGYSAICLAQGLQEGGKLHTIDSNEQLEKMARSYFQEAGLANKINLLIGDALTIIPTIQETFDLVFIDADKKNYSTYYDMVFDRVRPGGYIIADNVLWSGKVLDTQKNNDRETVLIDEFNKKIHEDKRVEHQLIPIRDGLMVARKL
ncbi:MAG TPA: O-methyltransferase [Bacteroidia bacterium]|jgi:predicted O-methyltransferase YrrM|nr:O-methyltransferase [Bacteroidia bacterium]HRG51708.1 O-methyltransferase [Bacteroidia bacterium]